VGLANVRNKKILVDLDGKEVYFLYNMGAAAKLSEEFGGVSKAQMAFNKACFNQVGGNYEPKNADELLTKEFFDVVKVFMDSMLSNYYLKGGEFINFFDLSIEALGSVIKGLVQTMGVGSPEAKEEAGEATPTPPAP
jgi:hypothetical protein